MLLLNHAPNKIQTKEANAVITWFLLGLDGNAYASAAALKAAGVRAWPGLDGGGFLQTLVVETEGASVAGSGFYIKVNQGDTPTDLTATFMSGQPFTYAGNVWAVWLRKTVSTDKVNLIGSF